ncbi:MAG: HEAT repeat domain-containing protein [Elusimicrobia bacterium]|nr:HEAT repeat domain-containing protein [Elusimicrobiota bacterium]
MLTSQKNTIKDKIQNVFQIQSNDWQKLLDFSVLNFQIICSVAFGTIVSTSMFVNRVGVEYLPNIYILNAVVILLATIIYLAVLDKMDKVILFKNIAIIFGLIVLIARVLIYLKVVWMYSILYVVASLITWIFFTQFWAIAVEVCNVRESRRIFSYIVGAGLLGGIVAGLIARYSVDFLKTDNLLLVWALFLFLIVRSSKKIFSQQETKPVEQTKSNPLKELVETANYLYVNRLVKTILICFLLYSTTVYFLDFQFNKIMNLTYPDQDKLTRFYGIYSGCFYSVTFLIQIFLASRIIRWLGIGNTMLVFPAVITAGFISLVARFGYLSALFAKFIRDIIGNSLIDSSYPVLFTPIDEKHRSKALAVVEGFIIPIGTGLAGVLLLVLRSVNAISPSLFGVFLGLAWLYFTLKLRQEYHNAFIENIISKTYHEESTPIGDLIDLTKGTNLAVLRNAMYDTDPKISLFAIETLGKTKDRTALKPLVELLSKPGIDIVKKATIIKALGNIKDTYPLLIINKYIEDIDERIRANAVEALGEIGGSNIKDLIEPCLKDPSARVRINTATVLWKYGDHAKAAGLIAEIFSHSDEESRIRATYSLSQIGDRELLPLLIESSYDKSFKVRLQSIEGLSKINDEWSKEALIRMLADKTSSVRMVTAKALVKMPNITDSLLSTLQNSKENIIKDKIILILAEKREVKTIKAVIDYCVSHIKSIYQNIVYIQGLSTERNKTPGINLLIDTLNTRNNREIEKVLRVISYLEKSEAISLSIRRLKDKNENIKAQIIEMLETTTTEYSNILRLAIPLLEDITTQDKLIIAEKEFKLKQKYFRDILLELLNGEDEWLKACAIYIIGEIKETDFVEEMIKETEKKGSTLIRETVLDAVKKIGSVHKRG